MGRLIDAESLWTDIMMLPHNGDMVSSAEVEQAILDAPTIEQYGTWIPCSDRLPESDYETVLCVTDTNFLAVMVYTGEHGFRSSDLDFNEEVIAWMPLPETYREEKKDE